MGTYICHHSPSFISRFVYGSMSIKKKTLNNHKHFAWTDLNAGCLPRGRKSTDATFRRLRCIWLYEVRDGSKPTGPSSYLKNLVTWVDHRPGGQMVGSVLQGKSLPPLGERPWSWTMWISETKPKTKIYQEGRKWSGHTLYSKRSQWLLFCLSLGESFFFFFLVTT